jgi:hypothetical protein
MPYEAHLPYAVNVYILSLIEFDKEEIALNRKQLEKIEGELDRIISGLDGKKNDFGSYSPYIVWSLPSSIIKFNIKPSPPKVKYIEIGYYHHRIIFNISYEFIYSENIIDLFQYIRASRDELHKFFRDNVLEVLKSFYVEECGNLGQDCTILFIYSYPLFVIEYGDKLISSGKTYEDTIYSDATTAFFFKIPESQFMLKNHFIRVSIPFTILYCSGRLGKEFFWNIINAIYFGGLYKRKEKDRNSNKEKKRYLKKWKNEFDEEILVYLSTLMLGNISQTQFSVIGMKANLITIIIAIIAIFISIITIIITSKY